LFEFLVYPQRLKMESLSYPEILLPGILPKKMILVLQGDNCTPMFIAELFTIS
jgi:hypothetical protein